MRASKENVIFTNVHHKTPSSSLHRRQGDSELRPLDKGVSLGQSLRGGPGEVGDPGAVGAPLAIVGPALEPGGSVVACVQAPASSPRGYVCPGPVDVDVPGPVDDRADSGCQRVCSLRDTGTLVYAKIPKDKHSRTHTHTHIGTWVLSYQCPC